MGLRNKNEHGTGNSKFNITYLRLNNHKDIHMVNLIGGYKNRIGEVKIKVESYHETE